jgi:hypothetical protein
MSLNITPLHVERGRQMRELVQHDIVRRGMSFEQAVASLAEYLGIQVESVKLAIAIANDADLPAGERIAVVEDRHLHSVKVQP